MRRIVAATAAVIAGGAGIAATAVGQGTGGSVGPRAQGQLEVQFRFVNVPGTSGLNTAKGNRKAKRPKVTDIHGGNGQLLVNGERVGSVHGFDVITFQGAKRYKGGAESITTGMLDFGNDNLLFASCRASDDERSNPCAITGGTGDFAGARGTAVERFPPLVENRREQVIGVTITFIP